MITRYASLTLIALVLAPPACRPAQAQALDDRADNKTICNTALNVFNGGTTDQQRRLQFYVERTFSTINDISIDHGGSDLLPVLAAEPYAAIAQKIAEECHTDLSETVYVAVARTYKSEANPEIAR